VGFHSDFIPDFLRLLYLAMAGIPVDDFEQSPFSIAVKFNPLREF
jgi:hypothetical protein